MSEKKETMQCFLSVLETSRCTCEFYPRKAWESMKAFSSYLWSGIQSAKASFHFIQCFQMERIMGWPVDRFSPQRAALQPHYILITCSDHRHHGRSYHMGQREGGRAGCCETGRTAHVQSDRRDCLCIVPREASIQ
uniref:Uncharacterized protein n=1 Tax=Eutreptiella gymnastica TaxID=73025 RepID=A0A7S1NFU3_9EUGL